MFFHFSLIPTVLLTVAFLFTGCSTSKNGSFTASSFISDESSENQTLGKVTGESRQTWVLYLFPRGKAPTINAAIEDAKAKKPDTQFLTDISIDYLSYWSVGYYQQIIKVQAEARK